MRNQSNLISLQPLVGEDRRKLLWRLAIHMLEDEIIRRTRLVQQFRCDIAKGNNVDDISRAGQYVGFFGRDHVHGNFNPETTALANGAFCGNLSVHLFNQLFADRKAQSCAAETVQYGIVGLLEGLEYALNCSFGYADTGIRNGEPDDVFPAFARKAAVHGNAASFGEFEGISYQIEQDVAQYVGGAFDQTV